MITYLYTVPLRPSSQQTVMVTRRQSQAVHDAVEELQGEHAIPNVDGITVEGDIATIVFSGPIEGRDVFFSIMDRAYELLGSSGR